MDTFRNSLHQVRLCCFKCFSTGILYSILWIYCDAIVIQTKNGPVVGFESNLGSVSIYTFRNIPYAKPPVGDLRFELPEDSESWTLGDLKQEEDVLCPQNGKTEDSIIGQEDCLYLDVYVRKNNGTTAPLPVLIYFHAGLFNSGSKNEYNPEYLLKMHDVIVVIPNYRLGILGFMSSRNADLSSNFGLWDQRKSMEWVQKNIDSFGGDNQSVTIAGHEAGGASVGFHILSTKSHRFFSGAISASGTALDPWVISPSKEPTIPRVAETVGCPLNSSDVVSCLKTSDVNIILKAQRTLEKVQFLPVVDGHSKHSIIPDSPHRLYQWGYQKDVPYLAGVTKNEASHEINRHFPEALKHKHLDKIIGHLLRPYIKTSQELHLISKAAKYHYLRGAAIPTFESVKPQTEMLLSDFLYSSPLHTTLGLHSMRTHSTFMYVFSFENAPSPIGVTHMEDAFYLFNKTLERPMPHYNEKMETARIVLCDMWGYFIKTKLPGDATVWKQFRSTRQTNYAEISDSVSHKIGYRRDEMDFWNLLVPDLLYYHNLSSTNHPTDAPFYEDPSYTAWGLAGLAIILMVLCVALVGVVTMARRRYTHSSILPDTSARENIQYSRVG